METWDFRCDLEVRDYEIDMQGVVNHAIYLNYLEYSRALFIRQLGINVYDMHNRGFDVMVAKLEQEYKYSLRPNDKFYILLRVRKEGRVRFIFDHEIRRLDDTLILTARVTIICLNLKTGRVCVPDEFIKYFTKK
jgi:acyl-CoA thioester hydrolase